MDGKGTSIKDDSPLKVLAGQNVYLGISSTGGGAHKSVNKLIREAGGAVSLQVTHLTTIFVTERGLEGNQADVLVADNISAQQKRARKGAKAKGRSLEMLTGKEFLARFPGLPLSLRQSVDWPWPSKAAVPAEAVSAKDFYTPRTRQLLSLVAKRDSLAGHRVAFAASLVFDVADLTADGPGEHPEAGSGLPTAAADGTPVLAGVLRRTISYYGDKENELLIAAAGGRFSSDIDASTTLVVTGMAHATSAMNAASCHRVSQILRQKVDAQAGPLVVVELMSFLEMHGLLDAARFLFPLAGPSCAAHVELLGMPEILLQSAEEITAATSGTSTSASAAASGVDGGGFVVAESMVKQEKLVSCGIAVPVAIAGGAAAGVLGPTSLLSRDETDWLTYLPPGIGKPLAGRIYCCLGGIFDMGDLSRVFDAVAKDGDVVTRFDLVYGWFSGPFAALIAFLGGKVGKTLTGKTTHVLYGHEDHAHAKAGELAKQTIKGSKRPGGALEKSSLTDFALEFGLAPVLINCGFQMTDAERRRFVPIPELVGKVHPPCVGVAKLHDAVARGWVSSADAALADARMALQYQLVSNIGGHKRYIYRQGPSGVLAGLFGLGMFGSDGIYDEDDMSDYGGDFFDAEGGSGSSEAALKDVKGEPLWAGGGDVLTHWQQPGPGKKLRQGVSADEHAAGGTSAVDEPSAAILGAAAECSDGAQSLGATHSLAGKRKER